MNIKLILPGLLNSDQVTSKVVFDAYRIPSDCHVLFHITIIHMTS